MKRGTIEHPKTKDLARLIAQRLQERHSIDASKQIALTMAVGILERLIHFTSRYAPQGDVGKYSDGALAEAIGWDEDDGEWLSDTLVECRFYDRSEEHRLLLHGWPEHSDEYADRFLADNGQIYADGSPPRSKPRKGSRAESGNLPNNGGNPPADAGDGGRTPADAGYQNQKHNQKQNQTQKQGNTASAGGVSSGKSERKKSGANKSTSDQQEATIPPELQSEPFQKTWDEWLAYRRESKLPVTARTLRAQLKSLQPLGAVKAIECVNTSIAKGWKGLFPENHTATGKDQPPATTQKMLTNIADRPKRIFVPKGVSQ